MIPTRHIRVFLFLLLLVSVTVTSCNHDESAPARIRLDAEILSDTLLAAGSVFLVEQNTTFEGDVVIEHGCTFLVSQDCFLTFDQNLIIEGSSGSNVRFKPTLTEQTFGGLRVNGETCQVRNLLLEGATAGFLFRSGMTTLENCTFQSCGNGIWVSESQLSANGIVVKGCELGIKLESSQLTCTDLDVQDCVKGMELRGNRGGITSSLIAYCEYGLNSTGTDSTVISYTTFSNSNISLQYYYGYVTLHRNEISSNRTGIELLAYPRNDVHISETNFVANTDWNILIFDTNWHVPRTLDVTQNYWGTTDPEEIAAKLRDGTDLGGRADTLRFQPFSPTPYSLD